MHKFLPVFFTILLAFFSARAQATEQDSANVSDTEKTEPAEYFAGTDFIKLKKISQQEDDLYDGAEIKPLFGTMSAAQKAKEEHIGFEYDENDAKRLQELLCSDEKLWQQVGAFIYKYVQTQSARTVPERRAQLLLVRNLNPFEEITEDALQNNFEASAAAIRLKMNEGREIYRMCVSKNNASKRFANIYILIYPYIMYYKVVVANLAASPEELDDATFIYNW